MQIFNVIDTQSDLKVFLFYVTLIVLLQSEKEVIVMHLQESGEMYLETILVLSQKMSVVRSVDVAEYMGYTKPSVSRAISLLKNANYVIMDKHGYLTLTEDGQKIAKKIYERHTLLTQFLMRLGVDEKTASEDACKMEHIISDTSFAAIKKHALGK